MKFSNVSAIAFLCIFAQPVAKASTFYVSPHGNDANPGTARRPFQTLTHARDAARRSKGMGKTILIEPGRFFLAAPLTLDERDSGVVWRGMGPKASTEVYGGLAVTGWTKWKGGIWRARVPKGIRFWNLVVDGRPAVMAQVPKKGSGFGGGAQRIDNKSVGVPPEWRGYDYSDAQVFAFIGGNWFSEMRQVLTAAPDRKGVLSVDGGSGNFGGMNERFCIRGVLEFLTEPGEWCLKHNEGFVYYWPKTGTPMSHVIVRPVAQTLLDVHGKSRNEPARNITFENLSLIGSDFCPRWYLFADGEDGSTPEPLQQGMVFSENVDRLTIRGCKLLAAGHSAIWLNKASVHCIVESNLIMGAGFAGVYANGWTLGKGPFKSAAESYVNKGHRIESNFIYDCGQFVAGGCGIQLYQSGDNLIARNEIGDMPRYGISCKGERYGGLPKKLYGVNVSFQSQFDFLHTRRNRIVGNEIYSVCRNSFDFGAIESWGVGRDNLWADNDLHDIDQTLDWDGWAHVLFADDACHYLTIRGNLIHHCNGGRATGAFMLKSIDELIEGNVVVDCRMGRIVTFEPYMEPSWDVAIRRNVFASDGVNSRYGDLNEYSFKGKGYLDVAVPPNSTGFQEVDHNFISPVDPAKRNPNAAHGMDLHSVFAPNLVTCMAASWDATRLDYRVKPLPGLKFDSRRMSQTGLRKDFPFDKSAATRRSASDKIQAEDYQRMNDLRTWGGLGVYAMQKGSWAKYANVDFGPGRHREAVFQLEPAKVGSASGPLVEIHIDSPRGRIIGRQDQGQTACPVSAVRGIHNVYLVFENSGMKSVDWFVFR